LRRIAHIRSHHAGIVNFVRRASVLRNWCEASFCAVLVAGVLPGVAFGADPVPLVSGQISCAAADPFASQDFVLPPLPSGTDNAIVSVTSMGGAAGLVDDGIAIDPGEMRWDTFNGRLQAGESVGVPAFCSNSVGTIRYTLYAAPTAPATFSGALGSNGLSELAWVVPGRAPYVADVTLSQGAITIRSTRIGFSQQVGLGDTDPGLNSLLLLGTPGPLAMFSVTIRPLPITISNLRLDRQAARPAVPVTARFSVNGTTQLTAVVNNASGRMIRSLTSRTVQSGDRSVSWNGRTQNGAPAASGTYRIVLTSRDPLGNVRTSSAPVIIDAHAPGVQVQSGSRPRPGRAFAARVVDNLSGLASASATIDGRNARTQFNNSRREARFTLASPRGGWTPGRNRFRVTARDRAGNTVTRNGVFNVAIAGRRVVLGPRAVNGTRHGWNRVRPAALGSGFTFIEPPLTRIRWRTWGGNTALGTGRTSIEVGLEDRAVTAQLRAVNVGRCAANGPLAYRRLQIRTPRRPGGPLGNWRRWPLGEDLC